jgi:DNA-binding NarL/FixJ family response regulator
VIKLSILIVDDQQLFREGLALILRQHYPDCQIFHAGSGPEALEMLKTTSINLILLDIGMPGMNGMELLAHINQDHPDAVVLVVTQYNGEAMIKHLLTLGIHGFIFKSSASEEIREAIRTVMEGRQYFPTSLHPNFLNKLAMSNTSAVLRKREAEILLLLKMGRSSKEIAERLSLKENTINSYREEMLQKTKTRNVAELIAYAYENGLLG